MKVITVGRSEENDVVISDPYATRHHLQIIQHDDGQFTLSDFGSTNGTYVNGQKISGEIPLNDMDIVRIGNTTVPWRMYFEDSGQEITMNTLQYVNQEVMLDDCRQVQKGNKANRKKVKVRIEELSKFSVEEINQYLADGARFVRFSYVISIIAMTFKRESGIYFLSKDVSAITVGWPYTLISLFFGWWGIPFGFIYTIEALIDNSDGRDVTKDVIAALNQSDNV